MQTFADPPAGWGVDPLADQGEAGGIVWAFGELPTVLVLAVVFFSWVSSEERRGRRIDRAADRTEDAELDGLQRAAARPGRPAEPDQPLSRRARPPRVGQVLLGRLDQHARTPAAPSSSRTEAHVNAVV